MGAAAPPSMTVNNHAIDFNGKNLSPMQNHPTDMSGNLIVSAGSHRSGGDGSESPTAAELRQSLSKVQEENARLFQQVSMLSSEKEKVSCDLERILGLSDDVKS